MCCCHFNWKLFRGKDHIYLMFHIRIMFSGAQNYSSSNTNSEETCIFSPTKLGGDLHLEHDNNNHHTCSILRTYLMPSMGLGSSHPFPHLILKSLIKQYYYCHFVVGGNRPTEVKKLAQGHLAPRQRCQDLKTGVSYSERCAFSATLHCIPWSLYPTFCLDGCK